jgi:hypothetical protein
MGKVGCFLQFETLSEICIVAGFIFRGVRKDVAKNIALEECLEANKRKRLARVTDFVRVATIEEGG